VVAVLGPNGAGKTSLLSALAGLVPWVEGRVTFEGVDISRRKPEDIVRLGISLTPEGRQVFARLTVEENLRLGGAGPRARSTKSDVGEQIFELFPVLKERWGEQAGSLSGGQQQQLAIARSLMSQPRLLMLDEPSLGLAPLMVDRIFQLVDELHDRGATILLVEQNARRALEIADRVCVLSSGTVEYAGSAESLRSSSSLFDTYLGIVPAEPERGSDT
jgi:branched-chain amino acid transport system ATP-binding protein